jgi:hypothetical protein
MATHHTNAIRTHPHNLDNTQTHKRKARFQFVLRNFIRWHSKLGSLCFSCAVGILVTLLPCMHHAHCIRNPEVDSWLWDYPTGSAENNNLARKRKPMVSTRKQKQALAAASDPLRDVGILQHVLAFLPGNWLILGAVCREWNAVYAGMVDHQHQLRGFNLRSILDTRILKRKTAICGRKTTLFSAAVASPAVARLAHSCGLMMCDQFQLMAGLHADIETLTVLRQLRMPLSDIVIIAVALSGRLNTLQQLLRAPQCPRVKPSVLSHYAARSGSISMLNWLKAEGLCCFDQDTCAGAAEGGQLAALQYLRSEGCAWDEKSIAARAAKGGSIELVDWVLQHPGIELNAEAMELAAGAGQIAICDHLCSLGCEWNTNACTWAASNDLDMLRWLREHGCPWLYVCDP